MKVVPTGDPDILFFVILMVVGYLIGVYGHIVSSNKTIAVGIAIVFAATVVIPLLIFRGGR